jgi:tRNA-2-methylthio-N6-dimethylallyladenosine synthase
MPVLHLPVQSGSSKVLNSMNRKHNIFDYYEIIEKLKEAKPGIKFSSDFIKSPILLAKFSNIFLSSRFM